MFFSPLITTALFSLVASAASAHMKMTQPPPLGSKVSPNTPAGSIIYNLKSPMSASTFPCNVQSLDSLYSGPGDTPLTTWPAGSQQSFTISCSASYNGGSCQAVLSEDGGMMWKVIGEVIGGCPIDGKAFQFMVPKSAKSGQALIGWKWFNHTGIREMYMNCAAVRITGEGSGVQGNNMFVANGSGRSDCTTAEGVDISFDRAKDCVGGSGSEGDGDGNGNAEATTPTEPQPAPLTQPTQPSPAQPQKPGSKTGTPTYPTPRPPTYSNGQQQGNTPSTPSNSQGYDDGKWWLGKYPGGKKVKCVH